MEITQNMTISEKLKILTDVAKYDVACTSSGVDRGNKGQGIGDTHACGICHTFSADGRCVSLLKYYLPTSAFLTVSIALTGSPMTYLELHLRRMRFAGLPLNFTEEII